jgi:hypothetical protein
MVRQFSSKQSQQTTSADAAPELSFEFELDKAKFTARMVPDDADFAMEYSELAAAAGDADVDSPEGLAFLSRFFRLMLGSDYPRFRAHLKAHKPKAGLLVEIMQAIQDDMEQSVEAETERPTEPSAPSSGGAEAKDERTSQLAALAAAAGTDGEVMVMRPISTVRPKGTKRKAG